MPTTRTAMQMPLPLNAGELTPSSPWCQRATHDGRQSWRHLSEGGFDATRYVVEPVPEADAKAFVVARHYSRSYPAALHRLGLFDVADGQPRLVGVAVFGIPVAAAVLRNAFPTLQPYSESVELSRFVLLDECPANSESWFLARCFEHLLAAGVRGVVSFADPMPRRDADGHTVAAGHVGTIYQASNAIYAGRGTARTLTVLRDGTVLNARAAQKVRASEQGQAYVTARLTALGASAPRQGQDPGEWLRTALAATGAAQVRHRGAHRYLFPLGRTRRDRARIRLGFTALPGYPKLIDAL